MEIPTYNPDKGRLVYVQVHTSVNTSWFEEEELEDVYSITNIDGDLLIREPGYRTSLLIQGLSRADINHDGNKARELFNLYL